MDDDRSADGPAGNRRAGAERRRRRRKRQPDRTKLLFLQTAAAGTLTDAGDGAWNLVLEGHHGGTVYFADRPSRVFGVAPTETFIARLGFPPDNPPNAALSVHAGDAVDTLVVELFDPAYDEASGRLSYRVRPLGAPGAADSQPAAGTTPTVFERASLFIDDYEGDWESTDE